jgi:hypothetical protein
MKYIYTTVQACGTRGGTGWREILDVLNSINQLIISCDWLIEIDRLHE